ncbi:molecular chaperone DnaK [Promicromonospora umidemergens]|uniref:Molecular chaperone DnaK n=1 Tax=Promicromonospora umidemergens TaxID=629679 RepID=A0ABP8XBU6_9MICO|nr:Hsp70 family protein [Promicromonospora umidemergens]MCP2281567.1 molecular chaperone DnaK [Promicromonospora umidemergens]
MTMRDTIHIGIDLGTTNSAAALATGASAEMVRNTQNLEFTPSAVYVSRSGNVLVGRKAGARVVAEPDNACAEFKLRMGRRDQDKLFEASGRTMSPEEMSAEVLKSLRGDVQRRTGEPVETAVITVPAAFTADQTAATSRAAELAGLRAAPLLQEPAAAVWAYTADAEVPEKGFWLVYDFGGGTFDAAVVKIEDGEFRVVNHAGDNSLGGKRIDWAIVEDVLLPRLQQDHGLSGITTDPTRHRGVLAQLKAVAETAKVELSQQDTVEIDEIIKVEAGREVDLSCVLTREDLGRIARPLVASSIRLCRQSLVESGIRPEAFERVLLVGGSSQLALVRELLADPVDGLGIPLDHGLDPMTVVARGAAIFAGTQRIPEVVRRDAPLPPGRARLNLEYAAAGLDPDPLLGGQVQADGVADWTGSTVEVRNTTSLPPWSTGAVALRPDGSFSVRLRAEEFATHSFTVVVYDPAGTELATDQGGLTYQRKSGGMGGAPTMSHSLGVGLVDNTVALLVQRNTELPSKGAIRGLRTTQAVSKASGVGLVRIPILQGEHVRADRNTVVGRLDVRSDDVARDLPVDTEVEVVVRVDASGGIRAEAFVPFLDAEFAIDVDLGRSLLPGLADLRASRAALDGRYQDLRGQAERIKATEALARLDRIDSDEVMDEIDRLLRQSEADQDAIATCQGRLLEAESALDEVDELLELPRVIEEGREAQGVAREAVQDAGGSRYGNDLRRAEAELDEAIADGNRTVIERRTAEVRSIAIRVFEDSGQLPLIRFAGLEGALDDDPRREVQRLLAEGRSAVAGGDLNRLTGVNNRLGRFLGQTGGNTAAPSLLGEGLLGNGGAQ